jgi:hypothetical protein
LAALFFNREMQMSEEKQLRVTTPEEYAEILKGRGELVRLPSGLVVRARRASMEGMALKGGLPMSLLRASGSLKAMTENVSLTPEQEEEANQGLVFFRELVRKNCLEPLIVYNDERMVVWQWPNGTRLEIEDDDFEVLAAWVRGEEIDEVDSFRERTGRAAPVAQSDSKTLQPEPVAVIAEQPA